MSLICGYLFPNYSWNIQVQRKRDLSFRLDIPCYRSVYKLIVNVIQGASDEIKKTLCGYSGNDSLDLGVYSQILLCL